MTSNLSHGPNVAVPSVDRHSSETGQVLFVDDERQLLEGLQAALRKEPFEVMTANSAEEGLRVLGDRRVDVVVSDERMPGMSGSEFLSLVRKRYPSTIRIILTGQASLEAAVRSINEGEIYRFLIKPCNPVQLAHTIKDALLLKTLSMESARLLETARNQRGVLEELEREHPGITRLERVEDDRIVIEAVDDIQSLIGEIRQEVQSNVGKPTP